MSGSNGREEVSNVTKARLISLLILAVSFSAYFGWVLKPIGFNDGGFW
jgi:hypothetical protein